MRDWSLPGYKYLGPGNKLDKGEHTTYDDIVAWFHDLEYTKLKEQDVDPYSTYSQADEDFRQNVKFSYPYYGGIGGYTWFTGKKFLADIGALNIDKTYAHGKNKRLRGANGPVYDDSRDNDAANDELRHKKPLQNLPPATQEPMSTQPANDGNGSGNNLGLKETPIDNPYNVFRGPPEYTFVSLPYIFEAASAKSNTFVQDYAFRMTSPYDCYVSTTSVDTNTGSGTQNEVTPDPDSSDASVQKARWFDYYAGMYNYYHVIGCQYSVYIQNDSGEPLWVYQMFYNEDLPPASATNQDIQLWRGVKYHYLKEPYISALPAGWLERSTTNEVKDEAMTGGADQDVFENGNNVVSRGGSVSCTFRGEYKPGMFNREIRLDSQVENWTTTNTNPSLPERLLIRIKPTNERYNLNSANNSGDDWRIDIRVHLNYLVEFKELKMQLRYPVQRQPVVVTLQNNPETAVS